MVEIYEHKLSLLAKRRTAAAAAPELSSVLSLRGESSSVAAAYGVSSRAIRDIWNRQTWTVTTRHLWLQETETASTVDFSDTSTMQVMSCISQISDSEFCCGSSE